jgi:hypothetical protein
MVGWSRILSAVYLALRPGLPPKAYFGVFRSFSVLTLESCTFSGVALHFPAGPGV